jgi:hypothetical protein
MDNLLIFKNLQVAHVVVHSPTISTSSIVCGVSGIRDNLFRFKADCTLENSRYLRSSLLVFNCRLFRIESTNADTILMYWGVCAFSTDKNYHRLLKCDTVFIDGTFNSCPPSYEQFVTIHGLYHGRVLRFVLALALFKITDGHSRRETVSCNAENSDLYMLKDLQVMSYSLTSRQGKDKT